MSSFNQIYQQMRLHGMPLPVRRLQLNVDNACRLLGEGLEAALESEGRKMQWLPEYDKVAGWLTNNKGLGLFMYGNCGRGKTLLCRYVLPAILLGCCNKVVTVCDMQDVNRDIDHALSKHLIAIDDVGTEQASVKYGERRMAFAEIMDAAEKCGKLVIVSTNLSHDDLRARYGDRTLERIRSTTCRVLFNGSSLR